MKIKFIMLFMALCLQMTLSRQQFWNSVYYIEGNLRPAKKSISQDGEHSQNTNYISDSPFYLQIFANDTFQLFIQQQKIKIQGQVTMQGTISFYKNSYKLISNDQSIKLTGNVSYQVQFGVKWICSFQIPSKHISVYEEQVKNKVVVILLTIIFGSVSVLCFSIYDEQRNKILHNLNKRCHYVSLIILQMKQIWVAMCLLFIGVLSCFSMPIYLIIFQIGLLVFCLIPTFLHFAYIGITIQKKLSNLQFYKNQGRELKCMTMFFSMFSFLFIIPLALIFNINIALFYLLIVGNIFQIHYSLNEKIYPYKNILIYDFMLMFIMSMFSLYVPILNFSLVSYKQMILFWNVYIFIFIFGLISNKTTIKQQASTKEYLSEETTISDRQQIPEIYEQNKSIQQMSIRDEIQ